MTALTHALAERIASRALQKAAELNLPVAVSIVDAAGHLVHFTRMDGVSPMAIDVTRRKAWTSANFRLPTRALAQIGAADPALAADLNKNPDVCAVGGGLPILVNSTCIGAIGVGGGRAEQDHAVAEAAVAAATTS